MKNAIPNLPAPMAIGGFGISLMLEKVHHDSALSVFSVVPP